MSTFRKKPFIESIIGNLTENELNQLISIANSNVQRTEFYDYDHFPEQGIKVVEFTVDRVGNKKICINGVLIFNDYNCVILDYNDIKYSSLKNSQQIKIYNLVPTSNGYMFKQVSEYCTIDELRRLLVSSSGVSYTNIYGEQQENPLKFVKCTQDEYDDLETKDPDTLYFIVPEE